jgi:hypothetical protein
MRAILALLIALPLAACATGSAVQTAAPTLHRGTEAAEAQTEALFRDANSRARTADVERVLLQAEAPGPGLPTLSQADFTPLVDSETRAQWMAIFDAIGGYTGSLVQLSDPALAAAGGDALQQAGTGFIALGGQADKVGKVSAVVGGVGNAILSAVAAGKAEAVVRAVDPDFNALMLAMADALGTADDKGLRGTVAEIWDRNTLQRLQDRYAALPRGAGGTAGRRQIIDEYLKAMEARDTTMANFASLRSALMALAAAHRAATIDDGPGVGAWIDRVESIAEDIEDRLKAAKN